MKQDIDQQAEMWNRRYNIAKDHQAKLFTKFATWYDIANTVYPEDRKAAPWRSKMLFPTLGNKAWQLAAKFIGAKPSWVVKATLPPNAADMSDEEQQEMFEQLRQKQDTAQFKLQRDYDNPELDESMRMKLLAPMMDAIIAGTGVAKVPWTLKNKVRFERLADEYGMVDMTQEQRIAEIIGFNDLIPVDIFNVFIAPGSHNLYDANWVIIREYKTLSELEEANKANGGKYYKNLDELKDAKAKADDQAAYRQSRNRLMTDQDAVAKDTTVNQLAIYECYDLVKKTISCYADAGGNKSKWLCLRDEPNAYWHGKYPLLAFYIKKKPHEFWGQGIFQTNERLDAAKNDVFNHYMDNVNLSLDGGVMSEEGSIVNGYTVEPGFELTYKAIKNKPEQFKFPEPNPAQLNVINTLLDRAIEDGTISPYAAGTPNSATDTTSGTKGGIIALQNQADDILSFGAANFKDSIIQLGRFWLSNNQQFMDGPESFIRDDSKQQQIVTIDPLEIQGDLRIEVDEDSLETQSKEKKKQDALAMPAQLLALQKASFEQAQLAGTKPLIIDFMALAEEIAQHFGVTSLDRFTISEDELAEIQQQAAMEQAEMINAAGIQPPMPEMGTDGTEAPITSETEGQGIPFQG